MSSIMNICFWALIGLTSAKISRSNHKISVSDLSNIHGFIEEPLHKLEDDDYDAYDAGTSNDDDDADQTDDDDSSSPTSSTNIVYISNADVQSGTYRITEPGTYILTEDLTFNFNAPTEAEKSEETWSPNDYDTDNMAWFPSIEQQTEYDGLFTYSGLYSLGFFAGVTVESDDVIIDLAGHRMQMAYEFYLQQRFFSLIELGNRQFITGQGVMSSFDTDDSPEIYPSGVLIKNGLLGLSSHHAVHGNNVQSLTIEDVTMHNFDVAGFACNGCSNVALSDSVIGPQNTNIPVLGRYTHARAFLPRLRDLADNYGSEPIRFAARATTTVQGLIDRFVNQMDMVYNHIINSQEYAEDDEEWIAAQRLFINPTGALDGGSSYGILFNGQGSATSAIGHSIGGTSEITLSNVEIQDGILFNGQGSATSAIGHSIGGTSEITMSNVEIQGIYANPLEKFKVTDNAGNPIKLLFGDTLDVDAVFDQVIDASRSKYLGDAYTDLVFAVDKYVDSSFYLNTLKMTDGLRELVFHNDATTFSQEFNLYGSTDIQLQSTKGAIGVRIDGVQNFKFEQLTIHNIENWGIKGSSLAGEYAVPQITGNEQPDIQYGYTSNRAQGLMIVSGVGVLNNVEIYDVNSHSGSAHGAVVYDDSNIGATNIRIRNIQAGSAMTQYNIDGLTLPNIVPMACSIELRGESSLVYSTVDRDDLGDLSGHFIVGYDLCSDDVDATYKRVGQCQWCYDKNAGTDLDTNGGVLIAKPRDDEGDVVAFRQQIEIASDCTELDDGLQYILPDPSIGTVIPVMCDNGWTMLNGALTPNIYDYFTSYSLSHRDTTLILPNTDDHTSWRDWFIPADDDTLFRVAEDCTQCLADDNPDTLWGDNTAYYATGDYLCFYIRKTLNLCSVSDVYCNVCDDPDAKLYDQAYDPDDPESDTYPMWQQCKAVRFNADARSDADHYMCTHREPFVWPSLGSDGTGCTCYKPATTTTYTISLSQAVGQFESKENLDFHELEADSEYLYVELTQQDFLEGTYRITQPGTYVLAEDIVFDFNAPPAELQQDVNWSPNDFTEDGDVWWWPRKDQEDAYPGASTFYNPFTLGYFAGISVETSDVILDLNGHSLEMSPAFYLQQRFFSLIELANRPFAPGKGAANWGWIERYATNVIVQNGQLGLSSHHCIHGNFLNNVLISNVQMSQFDVAGFGCGQCIKVELRDLDVGPQHQTIPVLGRYTHARAALPRLQYLTENYGDWQVPFWDRTPTISSLVERLINQMDMTYHYVINGVEPAEDDEDYAEWLEAKKLFINEAGYQDASASYGLVFAGGAAVSAIGTRIENEGDITINNVNVHGMRSHVKEKYKVYGAATTVTMRGFFRDTFDWEAMTDNFADLETAKYIGNAWEDIMMAVVLNDDISAEWSFLYTTQIEQYVKDWVMTGDGSEATGSDLVHNLDVHCGTDIQVHSVKGAIGVRVDGADNLDINGLTISDVVSTTELGLMTCGEYDAPAIAGEEVYIQPGYNGHRAHGLTVVYTNGVLANVNIDGVQSDYGSAYGLRVFDGCDIELQGDITVNNINAGMIFEPSDIDMRFMMKSLTNPLPQACGIYVYSDPDDVSQADESNVLSTNVFGYRECEETVTRNGPDDQFLAQTIGDCDNCVVKPVYVSADYDSEEDEDAAPAVTMIPVSPTVIAILVAFCIMCIYAIFKYKYPSLYENISKSTSKSFSFTSDEHTPLLT
eukprot:CAMPEP_0197073724 /NCGR_PEP_ID=MMETSP1384-20130603/210752_1 /TAXON_ID=29189 /ORGANISM="Ammonia sp." /LENGTH=1715 /DNA_ID=CAMNT_0042512563 /DNA_START=84 /DNA_END=5232 /DNA_ORIENTATION=+